ncbi:MULTISPECIES: LPXTG cell wall anchor domain-containing protein [Streptomycetaceae]|uniref:LPXTG cell wall anchor domain-containing protein n=1 Tax=unclassified Streptomyces TaxID=2593676 RepID=UPI00338A3ADD
MFPRSTLRAAVLTAVAAGAVLLPSAAAFADDAPRPKPSATPTPSAVPTEAPQPGEAAEPTRVPTAVPADAVPPGTLPRGGVAAGERAAGETGGSTALYGSAAGAVLLAGAGTLVLRRRSAAHGNG